MKKLGVLLPFFLAMAIKSSALSEETCSLYSTQANKSISKTLESLGLNSKDSTLLLGIGLYGVGYAKGVCDWTKIIKDYNDFKGGANVIIESNIKDIDPSLLKYIKGGLIK